MIHAFTATKASESLAKAILASGPEREKKLEQFGLEGVQSDAGLIELWRRGELWIVKQADGTSAVVIYNGQIGTKKPAGVRLSDGGEVTFELVDGTASNPDRSSRKLLTKLLDILALKHPGARERAEAARQLGLRQEESGLKVLEELLPQQKESVAVKGFEEGIALAKLKLTTGEERTKAVVKLGELTSLLARDQIKAVIQDEDKKPVAE
ncbi:MAG: hypothetical protein ACOYOF_07785, partial [Verrucomicrobiaceae bacterium]